MTTIPAIASYRLPTCVASNRVAWQPQPARCALLIHDMQDYFLSKYDIGCSPIPELIHNIVQLRETCKELDIPVFYTAQNTQQSPQERGLQSDFWGPGMSAPDQQHLGRIAAPLRPDCDDTILTKWRYSAFQRSDLRQRLRAAGRDQLIITGVYAHIGCLCTALEAFMQDVQPFFVSDATADFSLELHLMAINQVARCCGVSLRCGELKRLLEAPAIAQTSSRSRPASTVARSAVQ